MVLRWKALQGQDGHSAGLSLMEAMLGRPLPPLARTPRGKPYFPESGLHFSISHTKNFVFCCISDRNVGIDAEEMGRIVSERFTFRWLSESERGRCASAPDPQDAMLRLWVLKEAWAKLTGRGLGNYLRETDFDPFDPRIRIIEHCFVAVLEE